LAQVPALRPDDAAWQATPPDPLDNPSLYASVRTRRIFGYLVDLVAIGVIGVVAWTAAGFLGVVTFGLAWPIVALAASLVPLAYYTLTIAGPASGTLGMWLFDVEVRSWTGRRPDFIQALVMTVVYMFTVWPTGLLILLVSLFDKRSRTLHDMLAAVVVVRRSALQRAAGVTISAVATR
jgi:uncharacterized RDD family membrane protein YckC